MSSNALFATSNARSSSRNLIEFKAGKMTLKGKMVYPDTRSGLIYVYQSDDTLIHFCWKDRTSGTTEDDLIIFPDDCEFKRVTQCTTGRVYILKFKSSTRKFFFWLQDRNTEKDEENSKKVNDYLNNPASLHQRSSGNSSDGELQNLLNNMSQQQLMQLFGNVSASQINNLSSLLGTASRPATSSSSRSSSSTTTTSSKSSSIPSSKSSKSSAGATSSSDKSSSDSTQGSSSSTSTTSSSETSSSKTSKQAGNIKLSDLQNLLKNFGISEIKSKDGTSQKIDLSAPVTADALQQIFNNSDLLKELQKYLPSADGTKVGQESTTSQENMSPAFQQAIQMFSTAMQSGQLTSSPQHQIRVNADAVQAASDGNLEQFIKALQNASEPSNDQNIKQAEKRKPTEDLFTEAKKKDNKEEDKPAE